MKPTPRTAWENSPDGQAFLTWWKGDDESIDADGTVWIKGSVSDLDWESLVWIAPIEIGEKVYA